jgi:lipid-A-disaccharide synthase-like uncharacterized protein
VSRDRTFLIVVGALFAFMSLFGIGAVLLGFVHESSDQVTFRIIGAIGGMFSTISGIILGYLVGRRNGQNGTK